MFSLLMCNVDGIHALEQTAEKKAFSWGFLRSCELSLHGSHVKSEHGQLRRQNPADALS